MRIVRWMVALTVGVIFGFTNTFYVFAAPKQQDEPPLEIEITIAQTEVIVGAPMTWRVTLTPHGQQGIGHVELCPGDTRAWAWPDGNQTVEALSNTVVLDVSAVPLISGNLRPILEARYTVNEEMQVQLILGDTAVRVEPVETHIEANVITSQGTVRKGERLLVELWIRNGSPFTLTQVYVCGTGADLAWGAPTTMADIPPGETSRQVLPPTVKGQNPQPQLSIEYAWADVAGTSYTRTLYINGESVALEENIIGKIPNGVLGIIAGVITGALATIIPKWIEECRLRKRQKKINQVNVYGLLRLAALQSEHAADNGGKTNLALLEMVFKEEGLFAIVKEENLDQNVRELWKTAERHNTGLSLPGGAQRSEELRKTAQELSGKLDALRAAEQGR